MSEGTIQKSNSKKRVPETFPTNSSKNKKNAKDRFPVTLAKEYNPEKHNVYDGTWAVSKKLDGMRFHFDNEHNRLLTRTNKEISAPEYVLQELARIGLQLDGELFAGKGQFQKCVSVARKKVAVEEEWRQNLTLQVFDIVDTEHDFYYRYGIMKENIPDDHPFLKIVQQTVIKNSSSYNLFAELDKVVVNGEEGLMVRNMTVPYEHRK